MPTTTAKKHGWCRKKSWWQHPAGSRNRAAQPDPSTPRRELITRADSINHDFLKCNCSIRSRRERSDRVSFPEILLIRSCCPSYSRRRRPENRRYISKRRLVFIIILGGIRERSRNELAFAQTRRGDKSRGPPFN